MKAVTLTQPWASLVVYGYKQIETRSWATKHRGPIAIHASASKVSPVAHIEPFASALIEGWCRRAPEIYEKVPRAELLRVVVDALPRGAILGTVDLQDTIVFGDVTEATIRNFSYSVHERAFGDFSPGRKGWIFRNPRVFSTPIPRLGSLGVWETGEIAA